MKSTTANVLSTVGPLAKRIQFQIGSEKLTLAVRRIFRLNVVIQSGLRSLFCVFSCRAC